MAPSQQQAIRQLSTSSRVHPSYLPYLQTPRPPKNAKWIPPAIALVGIGYGVSAYRQSKADRETAAMSASAKAEAQKVERREALLDAYGDRSSIESLEEAIRIYESQQRR